MDKISSIMESEVIIVKKSTPIYKAVEALRKYNITALPVVDENGILQGIISEKDVLNLIYTNADINDTVEDYMTEQVCCFREDQHLQDLFECLINNHFRRIPIITTEGKITGIISRKDLIRHILISRESKEKTPCQTAPGGPSVT